MIKQEELEILKRISDKDIKKYRPELFSNNEKEKKTTKKGSCLMKRKMIPKIGLVSRLSY